MSVAHDATGSSVNGLNTSGSPASGTPSSITASLGADVLFAIEFTSTAAAAPSNVEFNSAAMTLLGNQPSNNAASPNQFCGTYLYRIAGAGTGSAENVTYTVPTGTWYAAGSVSCTGVGSVSSPTYAFGSSTSPSSGSITVGTGQMAVCAYGAAFSTAKTMSAPTGGTNRVLATTSTAGEADLAISDSVSTATFGATLSGAQPWSSVAVVLGPSTVVVPGVDSVTVSPGTPVEISAVVDVPADAAVTISPGTAGIVDIGQDTVVPTAGTVTVTPGTAVVVDPTTDVPGGVTVSPSSGTPIEVLAAVNPLLPAVDKLKNGQNANVGGFGDSTTAGAFDNASASASVANFAGWLGRICIEIGEALNVNVQIVTNGGLSQSDTGWGSPTTYVTSTIGGSAPTLTLYNAAISSSTLATNESLLTEFTSGNQNLLKYASVLDVAFLGTGFNDVDLDLLTPSEFASAHQTFIGNLQAAMPAGSPVVATTENQTTAIVGSQGSQATYYAAFSAMAAGYTGNSLPLSPPAQASATTPGVWVLDTQQAFNGLTLSTVLTSSSPLHPNPQGYSDIANWIGDLLLAPLFDGLYSPAPTPGVVSPAGGIPVIVDISQGVDIPAPANVAVAGGMADVIDNTIDKPSPATVTVTDGTPTDGQEVAGTMAIAANWGESGLAGTVSLTTYPGAPATTATITAGHVSLSLTPDGRADYYLFTFTSCTLSGSPVKIPPVAYSPLITGAIDLIASTGAQLDPVAV